MSDRAFKFIKMQATGNDFLIFDGTSVAAPLAGIRPSMAKRFCDRIFGFGADGFLIIERNTAGYFWDFYNADGSSAAMCGNAARAVGRYLADQNKASEISFHTTIGRVKAKVLAPADISVEFDLPGLQIRPLQWHSASFVDTGVPHAVVKTNGLQERGKLVDIAREIKNKFTVHGINVTFYSPKTLNSIDAITFERGVEDFTLSCGTGALAAAYVNLQGKDGDCEIQVPGGMLNVTFQNKTAILRGEAHYIGWCTPIDGEQL